MSKKNYLLPLMLLLLVFFTSCEETKEAGKYDNWRARNEAVLDSLQNVYDTQPDHGGLQSVAALTDTSVKLFYKKITSNNEGEIPFYTSSVTAFYRVKLINGDILGQNFSGKNPSEFDSPSTYLVSSFLGYDMTYGYVDILQYMRKGERWEVYIPYEVGYGTSEHTNNAMKGGTVSSCPGYSLLIFDVQLEDVTND